MDRLETYHGATRANGGSAGSRAERSRGGTAGARVEQQQEQARVAGESVWGPRRRCRGDAEGGCGLCSAAS
jgi:hypothetical protein